jgi:hypothetical protein
LSIIYKCELTSRTANLGLFHFLCNLNYQWFRWAKKNCCCVSFLLLIALISLGVLILENGTLILNKPFRDNWWIWIYLTSPSWNELKKNPKQLKLLINFLWRNCKCKNELTLGIANIFQFNVLFNKLTTMF